MIHFHVYTFFLAWPDIEIREISNDWDFLVLACDGIWDVLSNENVTDFVCKEIAQGRYPEEICENLMTKCLAPDCQVRVVFFIGFFGFLLKKFLSKIL